MTTFSRRQFMTMTGMTAAASLNPWSGTENSVRAEEKSESGRVRFDLGIASYSFRLFDVDTLIDWTKRAGLKFVSVKDFHLKMDATNEECAAFAKKFADAGLNVYSCGVIYMKNQADVDNAFRYAQALGVVSIVGVPEHALLPYVEAKVKETGILMAIHNHGPGDNRYPSAASVYEKVREMDPRMGIALDIGHSVRFGEDPVEAVRLYADRIFDFHFKDMNQASPEGSGVICGRGVIDLPGLVRMLAEVGYNRVAPFEYEIDEKDPLPGFMASVGYVRGLCRMV